MVVRPPSDEVMILNTEDHTTNEDGAKRRRKKSKMTCYSCQVHCLDGSIIKAEVDVSYN